MRGISGVIAILVLAIISAEAQESAPKKVKVRPTMTEGLHVEGPVMFTYVDEKHRRRLTLDLYKPEKHEGNLPAIVMYFGGGWQNGRPGLFAALAQALAQRGYVTIVPSYRLSGEAPFPAPVHDCKAAVRWARASAKRFKIDPDHIAVMGGSAGGHLAGFVAATNGMKEFEGQGDHKNQSSLVQAAIVMAGPMNLSDPVVAERVVKSLAGGKGSPYVDFLGGATPDKNPDVYRLASPLTHLGKSMPPALFIDGEKDRPKLRYPEFWKKMDDLGIKHEFVLMPEGPHPFWVYETWFEPTVDATDRFLKKIWKSD